MKKLITFIVVLHFFAVSFNTTAQSLVKYETPSGKVFETTQQPDIIITDGGEYSTKVYFTYKGKSVEIIEAFFSNTDPYFYKTCQAIEIPLSNIDGGTVEVSANGTQGLLNIGLKKSLTLYIYGRSGSTKETVSEKYVVKLGNKNIEKDAAVLDKLAEKLSEKEKEKYDEGAMARVIVISDIKDAQIKAQEEAAAMVEEYRRNAVPEKESNKIRVFAKNNSKSPRTIYWTDNGRQKKELVKAGAWVQVDGIIGDTISDDSGNVKFTLSKSIALYPVVYY